MIAITGALGFIGSNLVKKLNSVGITDIYIVDKKKISKKIKKNLKFKKYYDYKKFIRSLSSERLNIKTIFHMGANTNTQEWNTKKILLENYFYSKNLLDICIKKKINLIYASSASIYGNSEFFSENFENEFPLNPYAYSKFLFDQNVRNVLLKRNIKIKIVGFRYFNVFGPGEENKGNMSSPIFKFFNQAKKNSEIKIFNDEGKFSFKSYQRDFISIYDVVNICNWFMKKKKIKNGIYNVGTSKSVSFYKISLMIKKYFSLKDKKIKITKIKFPKQLKNAYQFYTCSNNKKLNDTGYNLKFTKFEKACNDYLDHLYYKNKQN